jgi:hypothetical protein
MELFIELRDGVPFNHPIAEDNFREVYPHIDTQNLPSNFAKFVRTSPPSKLGMFEVEESTYQMIDGIVTDVWTVRQLEGEQYAMRLAMLKTSLESTIEADKATARQKIAEATDPDVKAIWEDFLAVITALVITDPIAQMRLPSLPRETENGLVYSNTSSGSAPNVVS